MRRITLVAALALAASLTAPATAVAGGFATVGLSSLPDDARPGETWVVDLTVLQHGRTPLDGVRPAVVIEPVDRGTATRFPARPTGRSGVYRARVVFPDAGEWRYSADDGFAAVHEFGTVTVGDRQAAAPAAASAEPGVSLAAALAVAALAGLLAALAVPAMRARFTSKAAKA